MRSEKAKKSITANFSAIAENLSQTTSNDSNTTEFLPNTIEQIKRVPAGVIGATHRSITEIREERDQLLSQLAVSGELLIDPSLIDPSPYPDRLPDDTNTEFVLFQQTIEEEGQKVPIQVRPSPSTPGRYQIVYGHRRWRAAAALGRPVKAYLTQANDRDLVIAQGLENSARQNLSWLEKALFAHRMESVGIKARDIRAALAIDDSELTRFRSICKIVTPEILKSIGRAPQIGRPRWLAFADLIAKNPGSLVKVKETLAAAKVSSVPSDERFQYVCAAIQTNTQVRLDDMKLSLPSGSVIGKANFSKRDVKFTIDQAHAQRFQEFLKAEIPSILSKYFSQKEDG
jgi:ParB family chromosome partitioning protein